MTLEEFRALVKASTPGPWGSDADGTLYKPGARSIMDVQTGNYRHLPIVERHVEDAALIAAMRGHIELFLELWEAAQEVFHSTKPGNINARLDDLEAVLAKLQGEKGGDENAALKARVAELEALYAAQVKIDADAVPEDMRLISDIEAKIKAADAVAAWRKAREGTNSINKGDTE